MRTDAGSGQQGYGDDYGAEYGEPEYDQGQELGADRAYWRRRFLILCGGVVMLAVCVWLFPTAHQPSKRDAAAASQSMAALAKRQTLPSAATGPAWGASSMPAAHPTASTSHTTPAKKAKLVKKAKPGKKPGTASHPKPAAVASGACAPANIVLSLFTSRPSYARGANPSFSVYAVSTSRAACTLTYGAGAVQVVVTRHGHVVWKSAACKPAPAKPVRFTLGVPQMLTVVWNPGAKHPAGCAGSLPAGTSATLDVVAMSHGQSSHVRTFRLDR